MQTIWDNAAADHEGVGVCWFWRSAPRLVCGPKRDAMDTISVQEVDMETVIAGAPEGPAWLPGG